MSRQIAINPWSPIKVNAGYKRIQLHTRSIQERLAYASRIGTLCALADVVMVTLIDSHIHQAYRCATDGGLMRQGMKATMNALLDATRMMMIFAKQKDEDTFMAIMFDLFPFASRRFMCDGGGVNNQLIYTFDKSSNGVVRRIFDELMCLTTEQKEKHTELCAHLLIISMLSDIGIKLYNRFASEQNALLAGEVVFDRRKSPHYEKYIYLVNIAMKHVRFDVQKSIPDEPYSRINGLAQELERLFSSESMCNMCSKIAYKLCMFYIEYAVAHLRIDLANHRVDEKYLKPIVDLIGERDTRYLLRFLRGLPLKDPVGQDVWEYAENLPKSGRSKTLDRLRQRAMEKLNQHME